MNKYWILARSLGRRFGLQHIYYRFFAPADYEANFHSAILEVIRSGDVAWDIGANHGYYSKIFCEKTGATGKVFAFEPAPDSFADLKLETAGFPWMHVEQAAVGDFDGTSRFVIESSDRISHLDHSNSAPATESSIDVKVTRGDSYWKATGITPNIIKIDVEGFEEEVLQGMDGLLSAPELRAIFIEVHFRVLEQRGKAEAPIRIEKLLQSKGLTTKWVDPSHISGIRN
jgi:FkbM family methyltransferase